MNKQRERMAEAAHDAWSGWMEYLFGKSQTLEDGSVVIPASLVERWKRQMHTPYSELSEEEKESDRAEADRYLSAAQMKIRAEVAESWAMKVYGRNVLDETNLDLEDDLDRFLVLASRVDDSYDKYDASVVSSDSSALGEVKSYLEEGYRNVSVVDLDTGEELPIEIGYVVNFGMGAGL